MEHCEIMLSTLHSVCAFLDTISISLPLDGNGLEFIFFLHTFQHVMEVVMFSLFVPHVRLNVRAGFTDRLGLRILTVEDLIAVVDSNKSVIDHGMIEGFVLYSQDGQTSYKCVSPSFLLKYH